MSATVGATVSVAMTSKQVLRPQLEREHARWIEEVRAALEPAQRADAGAWARWNALRYLQSVFPARLDQERRMVQSVSAALSDDQRDNLWALGELLDVLREHLDHLVGLCHRAAQFSTVTGKILMALDHWCRAVEADLGPMPVTAVSPGTRDILARLSAEPASSGT